jgi:hypothetical protein
MRQSSRSLSARRSLSIHDKNRLTEICCNAQWTAAVTAIRRIEAKTKNTFYIFAM